MPLRTGSAGERAHGGGRQGAEPLRLEGAGRDYLPDPLDRGEQMRALGPALAGKPRAHRPAGVDASSRQCVRLTRATTSKSVPRGRTTSASPSLRNGPPTSV